MLKMSEKLKPLSIVIGYRSQTAHLNQIPLFILVSSFLRAITSKIINGSKHTGLKDPQLCL